MKKWGKLQEKNKQELEKDILKLLFDDFKVRIARAFNDLKITTDENRNLIEYLSKQAKSKCTFNVKDGVTSIGCTPFNIETIRDTPVARDLIVGNIVEPISKPDKDYFVYEFECNPLILFVKEEKYVNLIKQSCFC